MTPQGSSPLFPCSPRALALPLAVMQEKVKLSIAGRGESGPRSCLKEMEEVGLESPSPPE